MVQYRTTKKTIWHLFLKGFLSAFAACIGVLIAEVFSSIIMTHRTITPAGSGFVIVTTEDNSM